MSIHLLDHTWEYSRHKGSALLLLLAIADYANNVGVAWPNLGTLAKKVRLTERTVINLLKELTHGEQPELIVYPGRGRGKSNVYKINLPIMEHCAKCLEARKINEKEKREKFAHFSHAMQRKGENCHLQKVKIPTQNNRQDKPIPLDLSTSSGPLPAPDPYINDPSKRSSNLEVIRQYITPWITPGSSLYNFILTGEEEESADDASSLATPAEKKLSNTASVSASHPTDFPPR